ncbi:MAG: hypothetical protein ACD_26C00068G0003 [uncultured bacterium]|nr:MAG: hypothetical protein ACD_26C00068G0003 [uncultured bacterium]
MENINEKSRKEILSICSKVIENHLGIIEASRILADYRDNYLGITNYDDILLFDEIKSETDSLPIGKERDMWNKKVLEEKDKEIRKIEAKYRDRVLKACNRLLEEMR